MQMTKTALAVSLLVFAGAVGAGDRDDDDGREYHGYAPGQGAHEYGRVVSVEPVYREVRVSSPVRECYDEPVYHTESGRPRSAGGMLAGGIIGGIIGHQIGDGRGRKLATAVGTLVGAQVGHDAVNGHRRHAEPELVGYREKCTTRHRVAYEEVVDGYDVTYKYRGRHYNIEMPYHPGKRIKVRVDVTPIL